MTPTTAHLCNSRDSRPLVALAGRQVGGDDAQQVRLVGHRLLLGSSRFEPEDEPMAFQIRDATPYIVRDQR